MELVAKTKLSLEQMRSLNKATAKTLDETRAKGLSVHYIQDGKIVEKRTDGSIQPINGEVKLDCQYDPMSKKH
jgi:hypothetical protein